MVTFACKNISKEDLIRCSFNINKTSYNVFMFLLKRKNSFKINEIASEMNLDRSSVQKAIPSLHNAGLISRNQKNLEKGGYIYTYEAKNKIKVKDKIKKIIKNWYENTLGEIERI